MVMERDDEILYDDDDLQLHSARLILVISSSESSGQCVEKSGSRCV